jgi:hypothetical protein
MNKKDYDLLVIGGDPAGIMACIEKRISRGRASTTGMEATDISPTGLTLIRRLSIGLRDPE